MRENVFKAKVIEKLKKALGPCVVIKISPVNQIEGFPDLLILYEERWAALEVKKSERAYAGSNQEWWIMHLGQMGAYTNFIYPENMSEVLNEVQHALQSHR